MMDLKQLQSLVQLGESDTLEFKATTGQRTEAMKTVCAMLNGEGGFVIFGVNDKGIIEGQEANGKTLAELANEMAHIEPPIFPEIERVWLDNGRVVIVIRASDNSGRPYTYHGRPYHRHGSTTRSMPRSSYEKVLMDRLHAYHRWENQYAHESVSISDLDEEEIQLTVDNAIRMGRLEPIKNRALMNLLIGLGLVHQNKLLNAAVVLYAKNPALQTFYPQCGLKLARFRGTTKLADFSDNREYWGNLFNLLKRSETFLLDHIPIAGRVVAGKMAREEKPLYAPLAIREALANAFCHRDYSLGGSVTSIALYDDRLEIINPGSLHFGLTPEKLSLPHESHPWNPIIASVLYRAGIIEKWGSGTIKMIERCDEIGANSPEWIERDNSTMVIFYPAGIQGNNQTKETGQVTGQVAGQVTGQVTGQVEQQILAFCQTPKKAAEIQEMLHLKHRETFQNNYLKPLIAKKLLALTIPGKPKSRFQQYVTTSLGVKMVSGSGE